jgi:protein tyrosine phosphatase (PTP) superfamily phosphohydrolase (DUF442 family)
MVNSSSEILDGLKTLVIPQVTTTVRNTLVADVGTLIYDSTQNKLCFCKTKAAAATSWELITSVEEA